MTTCQPCQTTPHAAAACENTGRPMIQRTCTCRCDRTELDPAPYWTGHGAESR